MLQPQQLFADRYRVVRPLAEGGMGAVFVAEHTATEALVALKVLWPRVMESDRARRSFELEARIAARVRSEHIVKVLDAGLDTATRAPFLVMELLEGVSLAERVARGGPQPWAEVVTWVTQAARGLDAAHGYRNAAGVLEPIVHRDLKPENLFLCATSDGAPLVKILDFGIAKVLGESTDLSQEVRGTPLYMAPEQVTRDAISPKTDVWALGLTTYFLLTGRCYWRAVDQLQALFAELLNLPLPSASERARADHPSLELPPGFDDWFLGCVERDPNRRFATAGAAATALVSLSTPAADGRVVARREAPIAAAPHSTIRVPTTVTAGSVPSLTTAVPERPTAPQRQRRARGAWLAGGLGAVLLLGVAGAWWRADSRGSEPIVPVSAAPAPSPARDAAVPAPAAPPSGPIEVAPAVTPSSAVSGAIEVSPAAPSASPRPAAVTRNRRRSAPAPGRAPSASVSNTTPSFVELPP